ncbi:MAG: dTDP-4-dehydrorhamnose reductase [Bauldia sp.]
MKIVVTGKTGQVARSLIERASASGSVEVVALGRPELDLLDATSIAKGIAAARPDIVVSAAAYTAVDRAEDEPDLAHAVNAVGAGRVAEAAAEAGAPVIHLSTDYVFDGTGEEPHGEDDAPGPLGVYGQSKLAGERAVMAANPRHVILRTAWLYSPFGSNFVRTMLRLASYRDEIPVVADQWGNPTSALDVADGVLRIATILQGKGTAFPSGIYHLAGAGATNWSGLARHVFAVSRALGGPHATVRDIASADYPTKARRPANSRLAMARFAATCGWVPPDWRQSTEEVVARLVGAGDNAGGL